MHRMASAMCDLVMSVGITILSVPHWRPSLMRRDNPHAIRARAACAIWIPDRASRLPILGHIMPFMKRKILFRLSLLLIPSGAETRYSGRPSDWPRWLRRRGAMTPSCRVARLRNSERTAVKQDHVQATNTIGITRKGPDFHAGRN